MYVSSDKLCQLAWQTCLGCGLTSVKFSMAADLGFKANERATQSLGMSFQFSKKLCRPANVGK